MRGSALSTAAMVNFGSNILMTLCQTALMDALTPAGAFFLYLFFALISIIFVAYMVPETKGKTLEERPAETEQQCKYKVNIVDMYIYMYV